MRGQEGEEVAKGEIRWPGGKSGVQMARRVGRGGAPVGVDQGGLKLLCGLHLLLEDLETGVQVQQYSVPAP